MAKLPTVSPSNLTQLAKKVGRFALIESVRLPPGRDTLVEA
jgi:hypothetical protein